MSQSLDPLAVAWDAVFVGAATLDAIAAVDRMPHADERVVATEIAFAGGGPAATAAGAFSRLGLRAAFVGVIGADDEGARVRVGLERAGVDVSCLRALPGRRTATSVVVADRGSAGRAICTLPGQPWEVAPGSAAADLVRRAPWLHVDQVGWPAVSGLLASLPARARPRLSVDAGNPVPDLPLSVVDLYVPTLDALRLTHGHPGGVDDDDLLASALAAGAATVVATGGAAGSVAASVDGTRCAAPAPAVDVVSTLGAGDVFHGALLAAVVRGEPLPYCLAYANTAAALSCRALDGRSAIPSHAETVAALAPALPDREGALRVC